MTKYKFFDKIIAVPYINVCVGVINIFLGSKTMQSWLKAQVCKRRRVFEEELSPQASSKPYVYEVKVLTTERLSVTGMKVFFKTRDGVVTQIVTNRNGVFKTLSSPVGGTISIDGLDWFEVEQNGVFITKIPHEHYMEVASLMEQICSR